MTTMITPSESKKCTESTSNAATAKPTPSTTHSEIGFKGSIPLLLENISDTQEMINMLQARKQEFLKSLDLAAASGQLDECRDVRNKECVQWGESSFTRQTRKTKVWDEQVQKDIKAIYSKAKLKGQFTTVESEPYWVTRVRSF